MPHPTNNLDPNARHCMASAAVTFIRTFGSDERNARLVDAAPNSPDLWIEQPTDNPDPSDADALGDAD